VAFETFGFKKITHDGALWYKPHPAISSDPTITRNPTPTAGVYGCYALAHVNDCLIVGTADEVRAVKDYLGTKFKIKDLGDVSVFTGLLIQRNRSCRTLQISQGHCARQLIETYGMQNCNPVLTPMDTKDVELNFGKCTEEDRTLSQSMVGSLMYLAGATHPDISYTMTRLAQFASNPSEKHLVAIKRVLRYIKGAPDASLQLATTDSPLISYFDSSWLDNLTDRRSTYGLAVLWDVSPILRKSKKHSMVIMLTCESEYLAGTKLIRELCWIRNILMGLNQLLYLGITKTQMGSWQLQCNIGHDTLKQDSLILQRK